MENPPQSDIKKRSRSESHGIGLLTIKSAHDYDGELGAKIPIYAETDMCVGRDESRCSPSFRNNIVSGVHFRIYCVLYDDDYVVECPPLIYCEDYCSTNGTYVNGSLIGKMSSPRNPYLLNDGDVISIRPYWTFLFTQRSQAVERDVDDIQTQEIELLKDRYNVSCKLLGSGIYGKVFLASEVPTQLQLACKIVDLRTDALNRKESRHSLHKDCKQMVQAYAEKVKRVVEVRKKLLREIEFLSKLNHPNIVTIHRAFISPHSLYIFSELAAGGDLFSFLQSNGFCLEDLHARVISRQVAIAVEYLHSQGVAHRDLKPENILVMRRGIGHRVVLTDFGCAGYTRTPTGRMMSTVGTYDYAAPEVHRTKKGYTEAIDMWSLGVVTLCILTGDALITFDALGEMSQSDIATILANADDEHPKWNALNIDGKDFVRHLLVLDPEKRMTSRDAVKHNWFTKPARVAAELDKLYQRANVFWPKRQNSVGVVEDLPDLTRTEDTDLFTRGPGVQLESQIGRKIPDATVLRYFGLERHLKPPGASSKSKLHLNQKRVLEALKDADLPFINTTSQSGSSLVDLKTDARWSLAYYGNPTSVVQLTKTVENAVFKSSSGGSMTRKRATATEDTDMKDENSSKISRAHKSRRLNSGPHASLVIKEVCGNDLFGTPLEIKAAQAAEAASDEMSPYDPISHRISLDELFQEEDFLSTNKFSPDLVNGCVGDTLQRLEMSIPVSLLEEEFVLNVRQKPENSLLRSFSLTQDDRDLYDEVAKDLPHLVTAKVYSQAITRKKEQRQFQGKCDGV